VIASSLLGSLSSQCCSLGASASPSVTATTGTACATGSNTTRTARARIPVDLELLVIAAKSRKMCDQEREKVEIYHLCAYTANDIACEELRKSDLPAKTQGRSA